MATNDLARAAGNGANAGDRAFSECMSALEKVANEIQFLREVEELEEWRTRWGEKEEEKKKGKEKN
jgi:hypothetical protein